MPTDDVEEAFGWYASTARQHKRAGKAPYVVFVGAPTHDPSIDAPRICVGLAGWKTIHGFTHFDGPYPTVADMDPDGDGARASVRLTIAQAIDLMEELALAIGEAARERE